MKDKDMNFTQSSDLTPALSREESEIGDSGVVLSVDALYNEEEKKRSPSYITANLHNYQFLKEIREGLKKNPTETEKLLWKNLKNKQIGHKIRRQHIIDNFITDFACLEKKVVIEIDGKIHLQQKEQDELRTSTLNEKGYKVIRFTNEVFANSIFVVSTIKAVLDNR